MWLQNSHFIFVEINSSVTHCHLLHYTSEEIPSSATLARMSAVWQNLFVTAKSQQPVL